jgi:hypothetical protein
MAEVAETGQDHAAIVENPAGVRGREACAWKAIRTFVDPQRYKCATSERGRDRHRSGDG